MPVLMLLVLWAGLIVWLQYVDTDGETLEITLCLLPGIPVLMAIAYLTGPATSFT